MFRFSRKLAIITLAESSVLKQQKCFISGKTLRVANPNVAAKKPYPYKTKSYGLMQAFFDKTSHRMDENSKIICVEGPIGVGKTKFAKELADELGMLYVPEANMNQIYINSYGFDMRKLDKDLPEDCRSFDVVNFCKTPNHKNSAQFQIFMYSLRYSQYIDALAHLLSTGQGIVLDRSVYSDFVFLEAMFKNGYISKGARSIYHDIKNNTINELLRPHLVVYLDAPVNIVQDRIKARNIDYEVKSKVFTEKYLKDMEVIYKQQFLKDISQHAELLVYDWTAEGETEVVVEDIERIDFAQFEFDKHDKKMKDWRFPLEWDWCEQRQKFCNDKDEMMNYFNVARFDVPELLRNAEDSKKFNDIWYNAPGMKFIEGYNSDLGDTNILTKTNIINNKPI